MNHITSANKVPGPWPTQASVEQSKSEPLPKKPTGLRPQPAAAGNQIISIDRNNPWDPAWTLRALDHTVPPMNTLSVESPETLQGSAKPMVTLALLCETTKNRYGTKLADLRWIYKLTKQCFKNPSLDSIASSILVLIDDNAYQPDLPQARSQHTLALMVAAWKDLKALYTQLHTRAANPATLAPHMDLARLPIHALLVGRLMLKPDSDEFSVLTEGILHSLKTFSEGAQAQVHADICALCLQDERSDFETFELYEDVLRSLNTAASTAQCEKIECLKHVFDASLQENAPIDLTHIGALLGTLPPPGEPLTLSALVTMELLSALHEKGNLLTPEQFQVLVNQGTEMLRYFMFLATPGGELHPLINAAKHLYSPTLVAAFMALSPQEKRRFLQILPSADMLILVNDLIGMQSLPASEKIRFFDEILGQEGVSNAIIGTLRMWLPNQWQL
jgi:hypothetical protein